VRQTAKICSSACVWVALEAGAVFFYAPPWLGQRRMSSETDTGEGEEEGRVPSENGLGQATRYAHLSGGSTPRGGADRRASGERGQRVC
jgi:hypothetical protein